MRGKNKAGYKKYEGLFILDTANKDEPGKESIDKIQKEIERVSGRVETVQKMGLRPFARTTRKHSAGFYVNFIFQAPPQALAELDAKFHLDPEVFRWLFTEWLPEPERKPRRKPGEETADIRK